MSPDSEGSRQSAEARTKPLGLCYHSLSKGTQPAGRHYGLYLPCPYPILGPRGHAQEGSKLYPSVTLALE